MDRYREIFCHEKLKMGILKGDENGIQYLGTDNP